MCIYNTCVFNIHTCIIYIHECIYMNDTHVCVVHIHIHVYTCYNNRNKEKEIK